jgi:hypothetical protein
MPYVDFAKLADDFRFMNFVLTRTQPDDGKVKK